MRESRERGRFAYARIAGKHVSEESKGKNIRKKTMLSTSTMLRIKYEFSLHFTSR